MSARPNTEIDSPYKLEALKLNRAMNGLNLSRRLCTMDHAYQLTAAAHSAPKFSALQKQFLMGSPIAPWSQKKVALYLNARGRVGSTTARYLSDLITNAMDPSQPTLSRLHRQISHNPSLANRLLDTVLTEGKPEDQDTIRTLASYNIKTAGDLLDQGSNIPLGYLRHAIQCALSDIPDVPAPEVDTEKALSDLDRLNPAILSILAAAEIDMTPGEVSSMIAQARGHKTIEDVRNAVRDRHTLRPWSSTKVRNYILAEFELEIKLLNKVVDLIHDAVDPQANTVARLRREVQANPKLGAVILYDLEGYDLSLSKLRYLEIEGVYTIGDLAIHAERLKIHTVEAALVEFFRRLG